MGMRMVYMTASNEEEARRIGAELVKSQRAACVNIIGGMKSVFLWQGQVEEDQETVLIAKTTEEQVEGLIEDVKRLHSYDVPCAVTIPIEGGNPAFLEWLQDSVKS